jgi:dipeptidyl aminopeptidase/acylaminoacyl peptidase
LKSSYRKRPAFVIKDNSGEHVLRVKDISLDEQYSYRNGKIVYSAYKPDSRWGWRNYGEIRLLDVKSGKQQTITHRTKYFTPDISNDGSKIVAVNYKADGKCELHVLDAVRVVIKKY